MAKSNQSNIHVWRQWRIHQYKYIHIHLLPHLRRFNLTSTYLKEVNWDEFSVIEFKIAWYMIQQHLEIEYLLNCLMMRENGNKHLMNKSWQNLQNNFISSCMISHKIAVYDNFLNLFVLRCRKYWSFMGKWSDWECMFLWEYIT